MSKAEYDPEAPYEIEEIHNYATFSFNDEKQACKVIDEYGQRKGSYGFEIRGVRLELALEGFLASQPDERIVVKGSEKQNIREVAEEVLEE